MTDTPRTRTQLLASFPDNTDGEILPQAMRDFVVSTPGPDDEVALSTTGTIVLDGSTNAKFLSFAPRRDPNGYVVAAPYSATFLNPGAPVPANSSVLLPPGVWMCSIDAVCPDPGAGKFFAAFITHTEDPTAFDPVYGNPGYFFPTAHGQTELTYGGAGQIEVVGTGIYRQTQEMHDAGLKLGVGAFQNKGTPLNLSFCDVFFRQVVRF